MVYATEVEAQESINFLGIQLNQGLEWNSNFYYNKVCKIPSSNIWQSFALIKY